MKLAGAACLCLWLKLPAHSQPEELAGATNGLCLGNMSERESEGEQPAERHAQCTGFAFGQAGGGSETMCVSARGPMN